MGRPRRRVARRRPWRLCRRVGSLVGRRPATWMNHGAEATRSTALLLPEWCCPWSWPSARLLDGAWPSRRIGIELASNCRCSARYQLSSSLIKLSALILVPGEKGEEGEGGVRWSKSSWRWPQWKGTCLSSTCSSSLQPTELPLNCRSTTAKCYLNRIAVCSFV